MKIKDLKPGDLFFHFDNICMFLNVKYFDVYSSNVYFLQNGKIKTRIYNVEFNYQFMTKL